jgi:hypothetical protein
MTVDELHSIVGKVPSEVSVSKVHEEERDVLRFKYHNCVATVGWGRITSRGPSRPWATVYKIDAENSPREDVRYLLSVLKKLYKTQGYDFAFSFAETSVIKGLLYKLGIKEREQGAGETFVIDKAH